MNDVVGMNKVNRFLESKFIQICYSPDDSRWQGELMALDSNGIVWRFESSPSRQVWVPLPSNRALPDAIREPEDIKF